MVFEKEGKKLKSLLRLKLSNVWKKLESRDSLYRTKLGSRHTISGTGSEHKVRRSIGLEDYYDMIYNYPELIDESPQELMWL
jgi:hypothetical protein